MFVSLKKATINGIHMREIIDDIKNWHQQGKSIALATVIDSNHSAPRGIGAKMAISSDGEMSGSVSAGCVEGAVVAEALQVLKSGLPRRLHYGIADEQAWDVGLTCGGNVDVFVEPFYIDQLVDRFTEIEALIENEAHIIMATILDGSFSGKRMILKPDGTSEGSSGNAAFDEKITDEAANIWGEYRSLIKPVQMGEEQIEVFYDAYLPAERIVIVGAAHIAIHLVHFANQMGFHTIVVDPRAAFVTRERFPHVDELHKGWPQDILPVLQPNASTYLVVVSHDAKIDIPALDMGLKYPFRYVGLLGSKSTQADRQAGLQKLGYNVNEISQIYGPIGIRIGSRLPDEIALSIMAEIVAVRRGKGKS
jgi:xanthine dehydrogenase accessory factor